MSSHLQPHITVVMPAYNCEEYIKESIESVLNQDYPNFTLCVLNDGSTDKTAEVIAQYAHQITIINSENKGVSAARNQLIKYAKTDWIAFCDADDVWFESKLSQQVANLSDFAWSYTNAYYIGDQHDGKVKRSDVSTMLSGQIFEPLLTDNILATSSILIKKQVLIEHGLFDESLSVLEDWKLWLSIAQQYPIKYSQTPLLKYRVHDKSLSKRQNEILPLHLNIIESALADISPKRHRLVKRQILQKAYMRSSSLAEESGDIAYAFKCACVAAYYGKSMRAMIRLIKISRKVIATRFVSEQLSNDN